MGNGGLVFVKIPKLWYTLDVEVQAYLFMEKPLSGPSDPSDSRILLFLPPQRHADAILKSPIHFAFEEAWYIYYAYQTADRPQDPQFRLDIYEMMWVLDTRTRLAGRGGLRQPREAPTPSSMEAQGNHPRSKHGSQ